jgi:hypothetical protein
MSENKTLLETIKAHDAKMEALRRTNERLSQSLMLIMDDLIDKNMTLCLDQQYITKAFQLLKNRGLTDSYRSTEFQNVQDGLCDQSVKIKQAVKSLNSSYSF